jgi:Tfp pilus assembly protein PilV
MIMTQLHRTSASVPRDGFSLVEVVLAMVMLSIVLTSLAALSIIVSRNGVRNAGRAYETGLLTQEVDRAVAAPIESLAVKLGQTTLDTPVTTPWKFERFISVSGRADSLTVRVAIRPVNIAQRPDSIVQSVLRTR